MLDLIVQFTGKEQDVQNEATIYWFSFEDVVHGVDMYGIVHSGGKEFVVDCDKVLVERREAKGVLAICEITDI